MGGTAWITVGAALLAVSTATVIGMEFWLYRAKQKIRQETYQIYD